MPSRCELQKNIQLKLPSSDYPTLVLICKRPRQGQGKQRLAQTIGKVSACKIAEGLLYCALEDLLDWSGPAVVAPSVEKDYQWAQQLAPEALVVSQGAGNLGQRILHLDHQLRQLGHKQLIYIGSDAPVLAKPLYSAVVEKLKHDHVVLSAARDGGVTLMAASVPWPESLIQLPWSEAELGAALAESCRANGYRVGYVDPSYDIDLEEDLQQLHIDLADDSRPSRHRLRQQLVELGV